jgi:hypothetical protein
MDMLEKCFLTDKYKIILVAEKQFVLYNIYKNNFARISPGIVFKLPFKVVFFNILCLIKDKLYVVLFIFIQFITYIFEEYS